MGCSFSGLNSLYDAVNSGGDVWINENRFKIVRQLGEGGSAYVYLVKELLSDPSIPADGISARIKDPSLVSEDGTYAMKKVLIQNSEQLELVKEEIVFRLSLAIPICFPFLIMRSLQSSLHKINLGSMKHTCCFLCIWMERYWTTPML